MGTHYHYEDADIVFDYTMDDRPDPSHFRMHTHEMCELYCFLSGIGTFRIEGNEYPLEPGDILLMRQAEAHCIDIHSDQPYERMTIHFHPRLITAFDSDGHLLEPFYGRPAGKDNLIRPEDFQTDLSRLLLARMMTKGDFPRLSIVTGLFSLLTELRDACRKRGQSGDEDSLSYRVVSYVNRHLSDNLSLDRICRHFYISKSQLCRLFRRATGSTVGDYVTVKRILQADEMISDGCRPTEAAEKSGFGDYSTFFRAYRRHFHRAPTSGR